MASLILNLKVKFPWWGKPYVWVFETLGRLGFVYNTDKVAKFLCNRIKFEKEKVNVIPSGNKAASEEESTG